MLCPADSHCGGGAIQVSLIRGLLTQLMCAQIGNMWLFCQTVYLRYRDGPAFLDCVFRIAYCVRAGESTTIQLLYAPNKQSIAYCVFKGETATIQLLYWKRFLLRRLKGLKGTRVTREITRECVRLGKKFWAQHGRRGGGRRPPASRRGPSTGRAGGPSAAVEGVAQV